MPLVLITQDYIASMDSVTELHVLTYTAQESAAQRKDKMSPLHRQERARLLQSMTCPGGAGACQDPYHPRVRLLNALYGFSRYEESSFAEVKKWRNLYSHVPSHQKKGRGPLAAGVSDN